MRLFIHSVLKLPLLLNICTSDGMVHSAGYSQRSMSVSMSYIFKGWNQGFYEVSTGHISISHSILRILWLALCVCVCVCVYGTWWKESLNKLSMNQHVTKSTVNRACSKPLRQWLCQWWDSAITSLTCSMLSFPSTVCLNSLHQQRYRDYNFMEPFQTFPRNCNAKTHIAMWSPQHCAISHYW
jgi:hypothetical protein